MTKAQQYLILAESLVTEVSREDDQVRENYKGVAASELLGRIAGSSPTQVYRAVFNRWKRLLEGRSDCLLFTGTTLTPLAVGLGNESGLEVGLSLQRTYGMPLVPWSALKGLCLRAVACKTSPGLRMRTR